MPQDQIIAKQNIRIQLLVALLAVALFAIKAVAYAMTHSMAIYTDMMEGIANIIAGFFGLFSLNLSAQPRDKKHPYGHGKVEFVSALLEGSLIALAGAIIIFKVVHNFNRPTEITRLDVGIWLIIFTAIVNFAVGHIAIKKGRKTGSMALVASGHHLKTDTYSTIGIVIGLIAVILTDLVMLDKILAVVFALWIIYEGAKIIREAFAGIMDEADMNLIEELVAYLNQHRRDNWIDLHNLRVIKYGRILHIDAHMTVPWQLTVREAHDELKHIEKIVQDKYGLNVELFIHLDPGPENYNADSAVKTDWTVAHAILRHPHRPN